MECPECLREQLPARYCGSCGARMAPLSTEPDPLDLVPEHPGIPAVAGSSGPFALGRDTPVGTSLRPSDWTYPMRQAVAAWMVFSAVIEVYFVFQVQDAILQAGYPAARVARGEISPNDALAASHHAFEVVLAGLAIWLLIKALLAAGAYAGSWVWVFYACLALVGVNALLALVSLANVGDDLGPRHAAASSLLLLVVQGTAAVLVVWMVLGLGRYGPWASTRVPST